MAEIRHLWLWILPAALSLYIKQVMLVQDRGIRITARALGRIEHVSLQSVSMAQYDTGLTRLETLSFYRADLFWTCFLIPLVLLVIARFLPYRWGFRLFLACSSAASLLLLIQFRALHAVGRFLSYDMFWKAIQWGWHQPEVRTTYLKPKMVLACVLAFVGVVFLCRWMWGRGRGPRPESYSFRKSNRVWSITAAGSGIAILTVSALASVPRIPKTPLHASVLNSAATALWNPENAATQEFSELATDQLFAGYRQLTHSPAYRRDRRFWSTCKDCNVIYFIFETGAARFLPADDPLDDLPNLRRLRERAFIGVNHFSTYPLTIRAHWSIFSSLYDSDTMRSFIEQYPDLALDGVARRLAQQGYQARAYYPKEGEECSDLQAMGFSVSLPSEDQLRSTSLNYQGHESWMRDRVVHDTAALHLLESDMEDWLSRGVPFVASLAPDAGHHPWPDYDNDAAETSPPKRARAILRLQDTWLGELMQVLERHHQLDRTLIVVTGDHGVRTREEDSDLPPGTIDDYSYHVPLFIYAPKTLTQTMKIPWATSHIDITPTLYDLLGIAQGDEFLEGSPVWDPELAQRTTFLFGLQMIGSDGFASEGKFYMWNRMSGAVYVNTEPHFDANNLVAMNSAPYRQVTETISKMAALQQVILSRCSHSDSLRSHFYDRTSR
jgi:hypothetical protein